ncbi:malto-oligosyltrehalose trehalohydrolase [Mucilaginibacter sp.]|uniref:malto-oligosyltrehalose trehalohydrolase n=1 Tax=Mucilaginibacter sp. TaxID=1882438 RepID=UPI0035BC667F
MANNNLHIQPGISFIEDGKARVHIWAPNTETVSVLLPEQNLTLPLEKNERGYFGLVTDKILPGQLYRFVLNGNKELPDPASLSQPQGVHGPSQAVDVKSMAWTDHAWQNPPLADYLMYELHTGTFTPQGTFASVAGKLAYLKDLGITAIEIMPVAQFPGERNWGYDGVFPYAVQNSYGGATELMQLVDACHNVGLAVILDVVYNHIGPEGNYFNEFGPYFTEKYHTPWGNAINFDDAQCDEVRNYFKQNVLMWFRDFHIDALRLDAVHALKDLGPKHILQEIKEAVDELMAQTGRKHYLIIEFDLNDSKFINPVARHGFGMDAQWIDEFHHALRVTAGEKPLGYYSDFSGIAHLAKSYQDAYVYDGQYSEERQKTFGTKTDNPGDQFVVFSQNHDHVGNRMLGERSSTLFSFEMQKLMAGAVMVAPYLPMLFMGEEYAEENPFLYFVSHSDPELIDAVRKGRKAEFASFYADGEAPDPQAVTTFEQSKLNWDTVNAGNHKIMRNYYKALIGLRKQLPALHTLNRNQLSVTFDADQQTLQLHRWAGSQHVYAFMNFSKEARMITMPADAGDVKLLFNSSDVQYSENGSGQRDAQPSVIQPESLQLYISHV